MFRWDGHQARISLLLFLALFTMGYGRSFFQRPLSPEAAVFHAPWSPERCLIDATEVGKALVPVPRGSSISDALSGLGLKAAPLGSGFVLPRAAVLLRTENGWSVRSMTQRERWIWRLPMDIHRCSPEDLARIEGIGPSLGEAIWRFTARRKSLDSLHDLLEVPGIGPSRLQKLKGELALE